MSFLVRIRTGAVAGMLGLAVASAAVGLALQRSGSGRAPALRKDVPPSWFSDVTEEVGLNFIHEAGPPEDYFLPRLIGSGAALFDFDNDGKLDLYLLQNGGADSGATNRLFRQLQGGRFEDVTAGSGLGFAGRCMGVAVGDVNNDGLPDVLVTEYRGARLFLNQGQGKFKDVTKESGIENLLWGTSASFFDYDRDGWLDLVVVNYVDYDPSVKCFGLPGNRQAFCHPKHYVGAVARLFRNLGRRTDGDVRFEDVTLRSGLGRLAGNGLDVVCADFNGDHWPDIFVANDAQANRLWINQHDGTFKDEAVMRGPAYNDLGQAQGNMGIAVGDVNGDGTLDLFVTHLTEEVNTLWLQHPAGLFQDRTGAAGLTSPRWRGTGFGTVFADFDHDGALDLAVVNGRVSRPVFAPGRLGESQGGNDFWADYGERNQLFQNDGKGRFRDVSDENAPFCGAAAVSRGLACGDIDGDGAPDLLVTAVGGPARLFRNVAPNRGHWLLVRGFDPELRRDAYGAEVTVRAGGKSWLRCINPGYSYLCSNDPRAHFGLGGAASVDSIQVIWPDGREETFPGCAADQPIVLRKGEGVSASGTAEPRAARQRGR